MGWTYDRTRHAYVSPDGVLLNRRASVALRDAFVRARAEIARDLAAQYTSGALNRLDFAAAFYRFVEDTLLASFLFGHGGANADLVRDAQRIQQLINEQLGFASEFVFAIEREGLSAAQIEARAAMYADAAVYAYEEARALDHGFSLPAYPADHSTPCEGGCRCWWEITEDEANWYATWHTEGDDRVCPDCARNGRAWNPLVLPK